MATLNSQQYISIQCTTYKQIQNAIEQMESFVLLILSKSLRKTFLTYNLKRNGFRHQEFHIYCTFVNAEVFSYIVPFQLPKSGHLV
jgi:hypothetical protein